MVESDDAFCGVVGSLKKSPVAHLVNDDMIVLFDYGLDKSEAGEPSGREDEGRSVEELSNFIPELCVIPGLNSKYLVAPKARGLPAELTPNSLAASMPASTVKG